jgi:hypothetical protein
VGRKETKICRYRNGLLRVSNFKFKVQGSRFKVVQCSQNYQVFGDLASMYYCTPPAFRQAISVEENAIINCPSPPGDEISGWGFRVSNFRFQVSSFPKRVRDRSGFKFKVQNCSRFS